MVTCYPQYNMTPPLPSPAHSGAAVAPSAGGPGLPGMSAVSPHKDYTRLLHVDCSVEYELPDAAKPPAGTRSEPLLMIHPCFFRLVEAQTRTRFVNNLPKSSLSSPAHSVVSAVSRRPKVARLTPSEVPATSAAVTRAASRYKTRDPVPLQIPVAATPSAAKLDPSAVLSELLASTCSELNNNYLKQSQPASQPPPQPQQQQQQQQQQSAQQRLYERQLNASLASATAAAAVVSSYQVGGDVAASAATVATASAEYQQIPAYHPLTATSCKACQPSYHHTHHSQQHPGAMHPGIGNRMYGGGLVKAVEPGPEQAAASAMPQKVRRSGVKRCRTSRAQDVSGALNSPQQAQQTSLVLHQQQQQQQQHHQSQQQQQQQGSIGSLWANAAMLQLGAGISFESPATATAGGSAAQTAGGGVWGSYGQAAAPNGPAPPAGVHGGGTTAIVAADVWGSMFPHCREKEDENRVLWNSDSLLRLVPV